MTFGGGEMTGGEMTMGRNDRIAFQFDSAHVKCGVYMLIIYMKKLLDSDWLRTVQFFLNTVQKRGN